MLAQPIAGPVGFQNMDAMSEPIQQGAGKPFTTDDLAPVFEGQVGGKKRPLRAIARFGWFQVADSSTSRDDPRH